VTIGRDGTGWRSCCPALTEYGAVTGGETKEEAMVHIESAIVMILAKFKADGTSAPPDIIIADGIPVSRDRELYADGTLDARFVALRTGLRRLSNRSPARRNGN
jgi:predicted RNase H-like HicB family nuclease